MEQAPPFQAGFVAWPACERSGAMNLMLLAMGIAVVIGMGSKEFGGRQMALCTVVATIMTVLYFLRPAYMT
jgi:hypothetical protein